MAARTTVDRGTSCPTGLKAMIVATLICRTQHHLPITLMLIKDRISVFACIQLGLWLGNIELPLKSKKARQGGVGSTLIHL